MNDLGIALAWIAVQVTLLLVPALALVALASRRGPASGAWAATLSLALVVALSVTSLIGVTKGGVDPLEKTVAPAKPTQTAAPSPAFEVGHASHSNVSIPSIGVWDLSKLRSVWDRFGQGAAEPAARVRPWGNVLAAFALIGMGYSVIRLLAGLLAVAICRRRGRLIDDPDLTEFLDRLRGEMGCRQSVELREAADLTTPATAGWRRPVILLPDDWKSWTIGERRAVLAHELAHVVRGDYAAGLIARLAVVLNTYHPLVRWTAGRLELQQEQAADALAARFAGGRSRYLVVLARLALKQDGRSPRWPAREFLPDRGTLIRRIAMLRDQNKNESADRPPSGVWRLLVILPFVGLTVGVALLRSPARADGDDALAVTAKSPNPAINAPITPVYEPEGATGLVAIRPASLVRRMDVDEKMLTLIFKDFFADLPELGKPSANPALPKLGPEDIDWATCGIHLDNVKNKADGNFQLVSFRGLTIRTFAPFDWLACLRRWQLELVEVREGGRSYYQIKGPIQPRLGSHPCICVVDDRTIVLDEEKKIRALATNTMPAQRAYLRSPEWERASRGLLAYAISNEDGSFAKQYDPRRYDDATLSLFKGVQHWVLGIDDAETLAIRADARCQDSGETERITSEIETLLKIGRAASELNDAMDYSSEAQPIVYRMTKAFRANIRIEHADRTISVRSDGIGTLNDVGSIIKAEITEAQLRPPVATDASKSTKK